MDEEKCTNHARGERRDAFRLWGLVTLGCIYLYVPWHLGVFFIDRFPCHDFWRGLLLHELAFFAYLMIPASVIIYRREACNERFSGLIFTACIVLIVWALTAGYWIWEKCI
jgi:hypothetical protein